MTRNTALKIVNPLLALAVMHQALSGVLNGMIPPDTFERLHKAGGLALVLLALAHVSLNWPWIRANFLPARRP